MAHIIRKCTHLRVCLRTICNRFFSFFAPQCSIISRKRAAMPQFRGLVKTLTMTRSSELRQDLKSQPAWSFQFFKDPGCWSVQGLNQCQGSYKKLQPFFNDFSRTTLDFQGPPTRNIISQIVQKCIFPVHSNKTSRLELFASPTSLHSLKLKDFSRLCEPCMSFHAEWPSLNWANQVAVNTTQCQLTCIL